MGQILSSSDHRKLANLITWMDHSLVEGRVMVEPREGRDPHHPVPNQEMNGAEIQSYIQLIHPGWRGLACESL